MSNPIERYDAALSFAGEDRNTARELAEKLRDGGYTIFYDEFEKARLWGEDLTVKLEDIYKNLACYCVMFISKNYANKAWTNHERQAAISRAFRERTAYILPIRLDDTDLPGLPDTLGYLDLRAVSLSEVFHLLSQKLGTPGAKQEAKTEITVDKIRDVLAACYRRAVFARMHAQMSWEAMFDSLAECRATLQKLIVYVEPDELQRLVAGIIGELDFIERRLLSSDYSKKDEFQIGGSKLRIVAALLKLKDAAEVSFELPTSVTEEVFFTREDANASPSTDASQDPWMRFREYIGPGKKDR